MPEGEKPPTDRKPDGDPPKPPPIPRVPINDTIREGGDPRRPRPNLRETKKD